MNNYKNMTNEEIKEQLEWSDHHEFSYGYSMWAFKEIERLNNIVNEIKKLDLYISEEDYDYEENLIDKYIPFDIEDYIKELKGDSKE